MNTAITPLSSETLDMGILLNQMPLYCSTKLEISQALVAIEDSTSMDISHKQSIAAGDNGAKVALLIDKPPVFLQGI